MTNLTDKWRKGEIYKGTYYCKSKLDGHQCIASFVSNKGLFDCDYNGTLNKGYWEVLAEVPSFNEWQQMKKWQAVNQNMDSVIQTNQALCQKLTQLKEQLKECEHIMSIEKDFASCHFEKDKLCKLLTKINQVLGEE